MQILITGAAGNMGSLLAHHLLASPHRLRLLVHRTPLPFDASVHPNASVCRADLGDPATLAEPCRDVDCIVHFAGVLFAPRPETFLPRTNVGFVENLLAVWRRPTWEHLLALPDFHAAAVAAIEGEHVSGVYNLGDDEPVTLQEFLDTAAGHWGFPKPWRLPRWCFPLAGAGCEAFAALFGTAAPLTRDFVAIGMVSTWADTSRMKRELLPRLTYPSLREGLVLL